MTLFGVGVTVVSSPRINIIVGFAGVIDKTSLKCAAVGY